MTLLKALKNKVLEKIALQRSESLYLEIATENLELRAHFLYTYVIFINFLKNVREKSFFKFRHKVFENNANNENFAIKKFMKKIREIEYAPRLLRICNLNCCVGRRG